jgi:hypothetical protein
VIIINFFLREAALGQLFVYNNILIVLFVGSYPKFAAALSKTICYDV